MQIPEELATSSVQPVVFGVVDEGYAQNEVDAYTLATQRRVAELEAQIENIGPDKIAKDVFLRSITNAMSNAYDVIEDAGREAAKLRAEAQRASDQMALEVEQHREMIDGLDEAWEQIELGRSELRTAQQETESAQLEELTEARAALEAKDEEIKSLIEANAQAVIDTRAEVEAELAEERSTFEAELEQRRSDAIDEAVTIREEAAAEADALRIAAQAAAEEVMGTSRDDAQRALDEERELLAVARQRADEEHRSAMELKARLAQKWDELYAARSEPTIPPPPPAPVPAPDSSDEAFGAFFSDDVEQEPSRAWMFSSE